MTHSERLDRSHRTGETVRRGMRFVVTEDVALVRRVLAMRAKPDFVHPCERVQPPQETSDAR